MALLVVALGAFAFIGLRGTRTEIFVSDDPEVTVAQDGTAVVDVLRESGGFSLLGLHFTDSTHSVEVKFITAPGCSGRVETGDPWPAPLDECAGPTGLAGAIGGTGVTITGDSVIGVVFEVPRGCFKRLSRGMPWPTEFPECSADR